MKHIKHDGGRKSDYPSAKGKVGDCVVRAIAIATESTYKHVLSELCAYAVKLGAMPNAHEVYKAYLADIGWEEIKYGKKLVRISSSLIPRDEWVICYMSKHLVAMKGTKVYDTWNCTWTYNPQGKRVDKRVFRIFKKKNNFLTN